MKPKLPTFVRCADGKFYQDLVYQDSPLRRAWFICFDDKEPAEIVIKADEQGDIDARTILQARGFASCLKGIMPGRKTKHMRFFGVEDGKPVDGHEAISWFLIFKKGAPLPAPSSHDSSTEIYPFFPNIEGIYFGDKR